MSLLGNVIWLVFGGIIISGLYFLGGIALFITIIGIPFGYQSFKIAIASLAPFGKTVHEDKKSTSTINIIFNILWLLFFGLEIAVFHLFFAILLAVTIIGLPLAKQHIKLIPLALMPFGRSLK